MNPTDRKLMAGAGIAVLLLLALSLAFAPSAGEEDSPIPSTYASGSGGARAAYLLLSELGYDVRRWEQSPADLEGVRTENPGRDALLILADPTDSPSMQDVAALHHFVNNGGRVLFSGATIQAFFPEAEVSETPAETNVGPEWKEFTPSLPSYISRDAPKILMQPQAYWGQPNPSEFPIYGGRRSISVVEWRMGEGRVLWWAGATPLTNAGITRADNLKLFLNSVGATKPGESVAIYWDEYFHGQRSSLWSYVQSTPLIWGVLQFGLLTLGVLFTFSHRSGPIVPAPVVSRLSPLEFVDTMGGLYERAGAGSIAVAVSYRHFRFELARRLGLPVAASDRELAQAAGQRLGLPADRLSTALADAERAATDAKFTPSQALGLVRTMEDYATELRVPGLRTKALQEKT